jgi:hypothetical protein
MARSCTGLVAACALWGVAPLACGEASPRAGGHLAPFVTELRPDNPASTDLFRFEAGDLVEHLDSPAGTFRVHYTRAGVNAVPAADADTDGLPDFVTDVAEVYDAVLDFYVDTQGFRAPLADTPVADNGGSGSFDVYLLDFAGMGDGAFRVDRCLADNPDQCIGYMVQENDFAGYGYRSTHLANTLLSSHELFHGVQAAYDSNQGGAFAEGTATWASETFAPELEDFEHAIHAYLAAPDRPLDRADDYGTAIFFQFLSERFEPGLVRTLTESTANGANGVADPYWLTEMPSVLAREVGAAWPSVFIDFAEWNLHTGNDADAAHFYAAGRDYASVAVEAVPLPFADAEPRFPYASVAYVGASPAGRAMVTAAVVPLAGEEDVADLHLGLVVRRADGELAPLVQLADLEAGTETVDTAGAQRVILLVVNTATSGSGRRPGLCFGTPEEVAACRSSLTPAPANKRDDGGCAAGRLAPVAALLSLLVLTLGRRRSPR